MFKFNLFLVIVLIISTVLHRSISKYVEGELKTFENWAFLARFCFLSDLGEFEYHIEFNEDIGDPNLLLYFDTKDQWPSIYKTNKTCLEKEAVLSITAKQIVNLTARLPYYKEFSGCIFLPSPPTTPRPKYTLSVPTLPILIQKNSHHITTTLPPSLPPTSTTEFISGTQLNEATLSPYDDDTYLSTGISNQDLFDSTTLVPDIESTSTAAEVPITVTRTTGSISIKKRSIPGTRFGRTVSCHHARRFRSTRERWWFIAISNCHGTKGIHVKYKFLMTNGPPGDYWHEHFSADEFYILPVLMAFSIGYSFLMLGIVVCSIELKSRQLLHTTYKIFLFSVILQLLGILMQSIVYLKYAVTGIISFKGRRLGFIFMGASETTFLLLLLLLGKGFTVTRGRLPLSASIKLTIFMCIYVVTYLSIFIYEAKVFDPGEVLYMYESPAGYGLIILRVFAWFMFIYSTFFTLKHYPEKGNFYYPFNIFGTLWFISGPAFIISANVYIDKWVRESVVCAVLLFITFGGHLMFLILTMPSVANKNFPYHVRTTQIGIMELAGNAEQFGHHAYEPTTTVRDQTLIVPLTRRTEEIFENIYQQQTFRRNVPNTVSEQVSTRDATMENVLNWSVVRNVPQALPAIGQVKSPLDSIKSASSKSSVDNPNTEAEIDNSQPENGEIVVGKMDIENGGLEEMQNKTSNNFHDYIRDVPIELFTVSRMVVETNRRPKEFSE